MAPQFLWLQLKNELFLLNWSKMEVNMLPEKQKEAYTKFYNSTNDNKILDPKTTVMIQLASSFAIACYP